MRDERLPSGVSVRELVPHSDRRGVFIEMFRAEWSTGCNAIQWNVVHSVAGVLRGVHVHAQHHDYLVAISGVLVLGMHDLRTDSETSGMSRLMTLDADRPQAVTIPPGVCHGFYFPVPSSHVYAVSTYWDPQDEISCRFDCDELGLSWPNQSPHLSDRDRNAGSYQDMCKALSKRREELLCAAPG